MINFNPHIFETIMLVCFGSSWPFAIIKTIRSKTVEGKSIVFIILIFTGYCSGVVSKVIGEFDHVIWLYIVNGLMVFTEIVLYFKYNGFTCRLQVRRLFPIQEVLARWGKTYGFGKKAICKNS